jgi:hypothetical protein
MSAQPFASEQVTSAYLSGAFWRPTIKRSRAIPPIRWEAMSMNESRSFSGC